MSAPPERIDQVVRGHLGPLMKQRGFAKSGRRWFDDEGRSVAVVEVQAHRYNTADSANFTINLGLWFPAAAALLGDPEPKKRRPASWGCTFWERIGLLPPGRLDHWWELRSEADVDPVGTDVVARLETVGLPWLAEHADPAAALAYLQNSNRVYPRQPLTSASLALSIGEIELARQIYQAWHEGEAGSDNAHWVRTAEEWADRHGLA